MMSKSSARRTRRVFSAEFKAKVAPVVRGLDTDHDRRRGQRCTVLNRPVSLINRGKPVQINRATSDGLPGLQDQ
jgi:hypothetical protein